MYPYWLLFGIFAAGSLEYRRRGAIGEQSAPLLIAGGLFIALMIGLRFEVGGDWFTYENIFEWVGYLGLAEALVAGDPGYMLLNWIGQQLGLGIWFVNLACGLIFSWGLVRFARRQPNPWLAMVVAVPYLVIVVAMGYSRQGVAIGIVLAGLAALDRTSLQRFAVYIFFAAAFHKSAVIILPLVALAASKQRVVTIGLLFVIAVLLYVLFLRSSVETLVTNYVEAGYSSQGAAIRVSMNITPALLFLLFQKRFQMDDQQRNIWKNFSYAAFGTMALLFYLEGTTAVDRLALYLIPLQLAVFSRLPDAFPIQGRPNAQVLLLVLIYCAAIQFVWLNYATHAVLWLPYKVHPFIGE